MDSTRHNIDLAKGVCAVKPGELSLQPSPDWIGKHDGFRFVVPVPQVAVDRVPVNTEGP
jgi:hypothetical protein